MRYLSWFFVVCFVVFALLQFNDPDPWIWVPAYLFSAYTAYCSTRNYYNPMLLMILLAGYAWGAFMYFPEGSVSAWLHQEQEAKSLAMKMPFVEEARESMGLTICFLVNVGYLVLGLKKSKMADYNIGFLYRQDKTDRKQKVERKEA